MKLNNIIILFLCLLPGISWDAKASQSNGSKNANENAYLHSQSKLFNANNALNSEANIPEPDILSLFLAAGIASFVMKAVKK